MFPQELHPAWPEPPRDCSTPRDPHMPPAPPAGHGFCPTGTMMGGFHVSSVHGRMDQHVPDPARKLSEMVSLPLRLTCSAGRAGCTPPGDRLAPQGSPASPVEQREGHSQGFICGVMDLSIRSISRASTTPEHSHPCGGQDVPQEMQKALLVPVPASTRELSGKAELVHLKGNS